MLDKLNTPKHFLLENKLVCFSNLDVKDREFESPIIDIIAYSNTSCIGVNINKVDIFYMFTSFEI